MFHKMNNQWLRQEHFCHYINNVRCTYSLTVEIDITKLHDALKANGLKAYPVQIYMIATIVNRMPEFRMGLSGQNEPGYWDVLHPAYTIFNQDTKTFSNIGTEYNEAFPAFYQSCMNDIAHYSHTTVFEPKPGMPQNIFTVSSVPWVDFTAFNLNVYSSGMHLAPIYTIGKYVEQSGSTFMPLAMQLHHATCDGYHAGQFIEALREMAQECHNWLLVA